MASAYGSPAREYSRGDKALTNQGDNEADENESMDPPPRHRTPLRHNGSRWLRLICNGVPAQIESIADEPYVCDHTVTFDVSQPTISHHLKGYARLGWSTPNGEVSGSGTGLDVMRSTRAVACSPRPLPDVTASRRRLLAESLGTGLLVAVVVGSGIAAPTISTDVALELLEPPRDRRRPCSVDPDLRADQRCAFLPGRLDR
jgi:hypothetical protein